MQIIEPSVTILSPDPLDQAYILKHLELCGRTAYKSEDRITDSSAESFVRKIINSGHHSVLEHQSVTVKFVCDRGVSHELVRHRIASYTQESTRYCNYSKRGMIFVRPCFWTKDMPEYQVWLKAMEAAEKYYGVLTNQSYNCSPQQARSVLPNSLKTEIVTTFNLREWRYVLDLRTKPNCHPQMIQIMLMTLDLFKSKMPVLFED